ncbi:hypothetical protein HN419_02965 [Candidatus Woesearchaeota archaeon]|jgi:hypothetical protein|nr:hypothetical protein [Candidatus Woesearchaeota archaeon]MBT3537041.1 hypothetical protein [Candidatus Woesearchaeota archaeon]MBT4697651.1 hypothetical protein [Candidatus Woesearchaeota archaeon]MBT4716764.1 hypothetical protein [Candidatus Woesearchaeota archaeon]MBT7106649.1 hypothetical protein [Candidatus Woesearchaeota archaeon]
MTNINQTVWRLLAQDLSIQKNLKKGLINVRGLAKYLIETYNLRASLDAVISAIRRFENSETFKDEEELSKKIFKDCVFFTKNHMACLTIRLDSEIGKLEDVFSKTRKNFRLIRAKKYSKIIIDQPYLERLIELFKKEDIIEVQRDLSELRIVLEKESPEMVGVLSKITNEIAMHNVPIVEIISCLPDTLVYVREDDTLRAHQAIMELTK